VSPGNIVLGWGGTCKIVDFGIARAAIQLRTEDHSVAGKYNYMAPEQIRGEAIDGRADVFALGVILYELTVQKRLFRGPPPKVMRMVLEEPLPRPTAVRRGFPAELERILLKALARDRRERYESARALYADLKGWLDASGQPSGKRELAEYLREVFGSRSAKVTESDDFSAVENLESEELALNHGVRSKSGLHELPLVVDPEESEAELVAPPPRLAAPAPTVSGPGGAATQRPEPRAEQAGRAKAKPARKGGDASLPIDLSSESDPDDAPDQSTALAAGGVQGLEHLGQQTADALAATPAPWGRRALLLLLVVVGAATLYLALRPST
jgi:serine/threonine protein kinase